MNPVIRDARATSPRPAEGKDEHPRRHPQRTPPSCRPAAASSAIRARAPGPRTRPTSPPAMCRTREVARSSRRRTRCTQPPPSAAHQRRHPVRVVPVQRSIRQRRKTGSIRTPWSHHGDEDEAEQPAATRRLASARGRRQGRTRSAECGPEEADDEQAGEAVEHRRRVPRVGVADHLMYEMLPPNDQPRAPNIAKSAIAGSQSGRPTSRTAAIAARAPGITAPYSCPKFPRIPQPIDSESAASVTNADTAVRVARDSAHGKKYACMDVWVCGCSRPAFQPIHPHTHTRFSAFRPLSSSSRRGGGA